MKHFIGMALLKNHNVYDWLSERKRGGVVVGSADI